MIKFLLGFSVAWWLFDPTSASHAAGLIWYHLDNVLVAMGDLIEALVILVFPVLGTQ